MASVTLFVHAGPRLSEQRFSTSLTLSALAGRLELITGIPVGAQQLSLYSTRTDGAPSHAGGEEAKLVAVLPDDDYDATLGSVGALDGMGLKVDDTRPPSLANQFLDDSQVEKYEMDDDTYAKRSDTVRTWKQRNKFGEFADKPAPGDSAAASEPPSEEQVLAQLPSDLVVGARCVVDLSGTQTNERRGTVRFVGLTEFAKGAWVGVEYDEPVGKNDGSVQGKRYFQTRPNFGGFVKPEKVKVGDYPALDLMDGDDDDDLDEM
ncbi:hypothetical protein V8E36_002884 [Tilletia maclaganii]